MSLLLDALKRAEQAKQAKGDAQAPETPSAAAPPASAGLSLSLEEVSPPRSTGAPAAPSAAPQSDREAVRNVFAAKQPAAPRAKKQPAWLLPVIAVVLFTAGGGGWYVWNEVTRISRPGTAAAPVQPKPLSTLPAMPASPAPPPAASTKAPDSPAPAADGAVRTARIEVPFPEKIAGARPAQSASERAREDLARSLRGNEGRREPPLALKLARGLDAPKVSEDLAAAYASLRGGNLAEARRQYGALVAGDGTNLDARLGLATALARGGETAAAVREYRKALEIDPQNSTALTALLVLADSRALPALEADLRTMLGKFPESAPLHFALGNALAAQSRWSEAQQAYFDAWRIETDNADYTYNLAVSLDQLRQTRLARDYYQKAVSLAGRNGAQFDRRQVERRINELKSAPAP